MTRSEIDQEVADAKACIGQVSLDKVVELLREFDQVTPFGDDLRAALLQRVKEGYLGLGQVQTHCGVSSPRPTVRPG